MKHYRKVIFILLITTQLLTISCLPAYRSAKGLDKGEVHVSYNAPTGANVRYGIHENIETRITYEGMLGLYGFDIFTHFHPSLLDFGFGASYSCSEEENTSEFDINFIISKGFYNNKFNPYISLSYTLPERDFGFYPEVLVGIGFEWIMWESKKVKILLIPEFYPGTEIPFIGLPFTSIGMGFNYKF